MRNKIKIRRKNFLTYKQAKQIVKTLNLKSTTEWKKIKRFNNELLKIPSHPETYYRDEWLGWKDFANIHNISNKIKHKTFLSFNKAKKIVRKLNLKSVNEWIAYTSSKSFNKFIPVSPCSFYKQWKNWPDFLGNNNKTGRQKKIFGQRIFL